MRICGVLLASTALVSVITLDSIKAISKEKEHYLEEIIVSATRRSETVQSIPSNISAVTSLALQRAGVSDISGLSRLVPGLSLFDEGPRSSGNRNTFNLRGLNANTAFNNDDNPSLVQESVSTYYGETPVFFPLKLIDLERVEVLRGPQGTLYGAGSVGGTIRFIPKKPDLSGFSMDVSGETSLSKSASKANLDGYVTVNAPVSDKIGLRFSSGYEYLAGFIDARGLIEQTGTPLNPGEPVLADPNDFVGSHEVFASPVKNQNDAKIYFLRGSALLELSDSVEVNLNYVYQKNEADGRYEDNPNYGSHQDYVMYKAYADPQNSELNLINGDVEMDLGFARLTSATSFSQVDTESATDTSGFLRTNLASYYFGFPRLYSPIAKKQKNKIFTQEIRLVSNSGGKIDWIVGGFYLKRDLNFHWTQTLPGISEYTNQVLGISPPLDFGDVLAIGLNDETFKDMALFGELTWHVTDRFQITGGTRVFKQKTSGTSGIPLPFASKTTSFFYYINPLDEYLLGGFESVNSEFNDSIFKLNASYNINDDTLVYATWAQGFRAGGSNALPLMDVMGNNNADILTFKPDTVDNYEIGIKGSISRKVSYTFTVFDVEWNDFQTTLTTPFGVSFVDNIPKARSRGFESQISGYLTDSLYIMASYSYTDAEVRSDFNMSVDDPATLITTGTALPGASKHNITASLDYFVPLSDSSELILHGDVSYKSSTHTAFRDIPVSTSENYVELTGFAVLNSSISWKQDNIQLTVFGKNLTNSRGSSLATAVDFMGPRYQSLGVIRPRTFGVRLQYSM